jgi:hypothetical protein
MGIGSRDSDFRVMQQLVDLVKHFGAEGTFVHAGVNSVSISTTLSSIATSITTTRNDLLSERNENVVKTEKAYTMKKRSDKTWDVQQETNCVQDISMTL